MEKKFKLLITNPNNRLKSQLFDKDLVEYLNSVADVMWNPYHRELSAEELKQLLPGKDAVITSWGTHPLSEDILNRADRLRFIGHTGGTVKWLVEEAFFKRDIIIVNANAALAKAVAEYCLLMALTASWQLIDAVNLVRQGRWLTNEDINDGLNGKTIGLIGYGLIAEEFIRLLKPFDVKVFVHSGHCSQELAAAHNFTLVDLETVLESDVVSLHATLNDKTLHMIGRQELSHIKDGAILINSGRAQLIEESALMEELRQKRFQAVLDVFYEEPLPRSHELRTLDNVICTPHFAGTNRYWRKRQADIVVSMMMDYFLGKEVKNAITLKQYQRLTPV